MATTDTNDTEASVAQAKRIIDAGGELVRFTTQGTREAENMQHISARLKADGYPQPLVADVHFTAHTADVAALYCEKVRIVRRYVSIQAIMLIRVVCSSIWNIPMRNMPPNCRRLNGSSFLS